MLLLKYINHGNGFASHEVSFTTLLQIVSHMQYSTVGHCAFTERQMTEIHHSP